MRRAAIPRVPPSDREREAFDAAVKENIELSNGRRGTAIRPLPVDATLADVISKVNEILNVLQ